MLLIVVWIIVALGRSKMTAGEVEGLCYVVV